MSVGEGRREDDNSSVRVAIRIRPQNAMEKIDMCRLCTAVTDKDRQVVLGKDKAFTFDYVFDMRTQQEAVYKTCVSSLVEGCFEGYNATVFAYGQTGSGKTYTMGTGFDTSLASVTEEIGIVPRAIDHLFCGIEKRRSVAFENQMPAPDFKVTAQFMELYNEEIIDLLDTSKDPQLKGKKSQHRIHEDAGGGIYIVGVTIRPVSSLDDTLQCLKSGALSRATASTNMNISSSRSHAIFTLHIRQHRVVTDETLSMEGKDTDSTRAEFETLTAKFHFVDLAGSERLKRTGATGDRAKEGISINCGLLALGNVISALGDNTKRGSHVPYRDSKLTRLLQDSLGGNSRTLMIACVSPCDRDFMETLNTLKYANRARNIRNKVIANQDKASKQLALLRAEILSLQQELIEFKTGRKTIDVDGIESVSDMVVENSLLQSENDKMQYRIKALQDTVDTVKTRNAQLLADAALLSVVGSDVQATNTDVSNQIRKYIHEIEDLKTKLVESESMCEHLSKSTVHCQRSPSSTSTSHSSMITSSLAGDMYASASSDYTDTSVLREAKMEMRRLKNLQKLNSHKVNYRDNPDSLQISHRVNEHVINLEKSEHERNGDDGNIDDEENDTDAEEEDSDSDTSLDSTEKDSDNMHEDLANLTCEITIKQRLIEELEKTQKKMNALKAHYENRVQQLQLKIKETEMERDRVLSDVEKMSHSSADTTKKVKQEFEKKLISLQDELKKMQAEQRKHVKMQKNTSQYEQHLKTLQHDLAEMKKSKVRLMKKVKEEVDKNKRNENRCSKELCQLRKERLRMDSIIKNLERQTAQKDAVLRRKQEEVEALRRRQKPLFSKAAGRVEKYSRITSFPLVLSTSRRRGPEYSSKIAKQKWDSMEKNIASVISKRQTIAMLEHDMEVWLKQRERCSKEIEKYQQRMQEAVNFKQPEEVVSKLNNTIEDLSLKVEHAQENIIECQSNIMQMEESKEDGETRIEISSLMETMTLEESKYVIEKLYQRALDKGLHMAQKESEVRELQGRLHQTELNNALQHDLLRQVMDDHVSIEIDDTKTHSDQDNMESTSRSSSLSPAEGMLDIKAALAVPIFTSTSDTLVYKEKARKRTATTHDLLYAASKEPARVLLPLLEVSDEAKQNEAKVVSSHDISVVNGPVSGGSAENEVDSVEEELKIGLSNEKPVMPTPYFTPRKNSIFTRPSPILYRKEPDLVQSSPMNVSNSVGNTSSVTTLLVSPTLVRQVVERSSDENVFSRLTSKSANTLTNSDRGSILPSSFNRQNLAGKTILSCTHTAVGHTKSVLSVFATDQFLFTGSKDRTAKTWDLNTGKELTSFLGHPSNVQKVIYNPHTALVFTVSQSLIKVWDMRKSSDPCIKTLSSSGQSVSGCSMLPSNRQVDPLFHDHQINDLQLCPEGNLLYCGAGNFVQIWDLRRFCQIGRLAGHQAPVMALALSSNGENQMVISGSKDHYIKIFEVLEDATRNQTPKYNLDPPHYDGIQCLALQDHTLFSGSRDTCIKKWDLITKQLKHSINAAHKDWVCALNFLPNTDILLSGCRGGCLKLWQSDTCASLGEIRGHSSPINAIATNSAAVFTASNEAVVHIWKSSAQLQAEQSRTTYVICIQDIPTSSTAQVDSLDSRCQ